MAAPLDFASLVRSDFWFADGNIILIAGGAAFKVHRGQLARHSDVFADLFAIPQPTDQPLLDGCLWVQLHDGPADVFYFLRALYDGLYFQTPSADDFPALAAVLRLASKYLVEPLRARCLARLTRDWPATLAGWDARERAATDAAGRYAPRVRFAHPVLVVAAARALGGDAAPLLPAALYDLARYGPSKILQGAPAAVHAAGVPQARRAGDDEDEHRDEDGEDGEDGAACVRLPRALLCDTFRGREAGQRFVAAFIARELVARAPSPACTNRPPPPSASSVLGGADGERESVLCTESFYFIMLNILRAVGGIACGRDGDPLFTLAQAGEMLSRTDFSDGRGEARCGLRLCGACKADFAAAVGRAREEAWAEIPRWFGLEEREGGGEKGGEQA